VAAVASWNTDPAWSTVHTCNVTPASDDCHVTSLREVTAARIKDIVALSTLTRPLPIERLVWGYAYDTERSWSEACSVELTPRTTAAFAQCAVLPNMRRLELSTS